MVYRKPEIVENGLAIHGIQASFDKGMDVNDNINDPTSRTLDLYQSEE